MNFLKTYNHFFEKYFPSPLTITLGLTLLTFLLAHFLTPSESSFTEYSGTLAIYWFEGLWQENLLAFTIHMMLILVLGHILALSKPAQNLINFGLKFCTNTGNAALIITFSTIIVSMFNWGLCLIFGAIFARKIGEHFQKNERKLNYPLIGSAAYVGMMAWHGGLSGSAPLTVAGANHSLIAEMGIIPIQSTILSVMNLSVSISLLIVLPILFYFLGKKSKYASSLKLRYKNVNLKETFHATPAQKFEQNNLVGIFIGMMILLVFIFLGIKNIQQGGSFLNILNLQTTNLMLLGLCFLLHGNIQSLNKALQEAISGVSGILIQFPLYFGIMGMMANSGMVETLSTAVIQYANEFTLPIFTFISAGIVNIFIPSGGGQWQIQGPLIAESAMRIGVDLPKMVMALSYGDQITNMLQPFWALPLLGITGLKAKEILPYTLLMFLVGSFIFLLGLIIF